MKIPKGGLHNINQSSQANINDSWNVLATDENNAVLIAVDKCGTKKTVGVHTQYRFDFFNHKFLNGIVQLLFGGGHDKLLTGKIFDFFIPRLRFLHQFTCDFFRMGGKKFIQLRFACYHYRFSVFLYLY